MARESRVLVLYRNENLLPAAIEWPARYDNAPSGDIRSQAALRSSSVNPAACGRCTHACKTLNVTTVACNAQWSVPNGPTVTLRPAVNHGSCVYDIYIFMQMPPTDVDAVSCCPSLIGALISGLEDDHRYT